MFTSNVLKSKENTSSEGAGVCGPSRFLCGALLSISLSLGIPAAHAQLVFGGSLNDIVEESVEDSAE